MKPVRLEASARSIVLWCSDCPPWRELHGNQADAMLEAADHLAHVHGLHGQARRLRENARRIQRRHAEQGKPVSKRRTPGEGL